MKFLNTIARLTILLIGAAGFGGFFVPVIRRRILNAGNAAGMLICAMVMLYAVFMPRIHGLICMIWRKAAGKVVLCILAAGLIGAAVLVVVITSLMIKAAAVEPSSNATVIVLGCKVYGERPSIMLTARMDAALEYLGENPASACIVSGGQGSDELISEAECMYTYLTGHGISPGQIYKEDKSASTRENIAFSYDIIKEQGLNENIAIATNNFHEYRAQKIAEDFGLESGAVSGGTLPWLLPTYYAREVMAILYEWIF